MYTGTSKSRMIATRSTYDIMLITVTLVLAACFRLATAIPREPRSNDKPIDARTHFTPLPEQQQQQQQHAYYIPEGIHYHANCNVNTLDCTWGQLYNNAWVYVECWNDSPLNAKSSFYKKLIRNDSALQGLEGRQYLNMPISHFRPNAYSYCYIFAAIQENWHQLRTSAWCGLPQSRS
ncbi:hypothetical protein BDF22DRAFT_734172 [Syncephalis plumigaleata]|nr:hypothetical protein BDF22DRAFT_734172 [Syncephalis plumigaleata]